VSDEQLTKTDGALAPVQSVITKLGETASAGSVFGQPVQNGDVIVIPCAEVVAGMGAGGGEGESQEEDEDGVGSGGGGGGYGKGRPVAAIIIRRDSVEVRPVIDITTIALAALTARAFIASWLFRLRRAAKHADSGNGPSFDEAKQAIKQRTE
jgi:uncharacterized spore protein YtfJ